MTALIWAAIKVHKEVAKLVLDHGADTNVQDEVSIIELVYMNSVYVCAHAQATSRLILFLIA